MACKTRVSATNDYGVEGPLSSYSPVSEDWFVTSFLSRTGRIENPLR